MQHEGSPINFAEVEETRSEVSVPLQHATYEAIHQLGKNFEELKQDMGKKLVIEVEHSKHQDKKVSIKSKCITDHACLRGSTRLLIVVSLQVKL